MSGIIIKNLFNILWSLVQISSPCIPWWDLAATARGSMANNKGEIGQPSRHPLDRVRVLDVILLARIFA